MSYERSTTPQFVIRNAQRNTYFKYTRIAMPYQTIRFSVTIDEARKFATRNDAERTMKELRARLHYPADLKVEQL